MRCENAFFFFIFAAHSPLFTVTSHFRLLQPSTTRSMEALLKCLQYFSSPGSNFGKTTIFRLYHQSLRVLHFMANEGALSSSRLVLIYLQSVFSFFIPTIAIAIYAIYCRHPHISLFKRIVPASVPEDRCVERSSSRNCPHCAGYHTHLPNQSSDLPPIIHLPNPKLSSEFEDPYFFFIFAMKFSTLHRQIDPSSSSPLVLIDAMRECIFVLYFRSSFSTLHRRQPFPPSTTFNN
ncbi:hypothetical protein K1719_009326 [Acacia pycnantha]|nr:hypothetical protein K1719_009326 [Acacia pycnantha]